MKKMHVKFDSVEQVKLFVDEINKLEANFELGSGGRIVDPKSILGVLTLDLTQPHELRWDSDNLKTINSIQPFLYKKRM